MISEGYLVVDNFLCTQDIEKMSNLFTHDVNWKKNSQIRDNHYSHVFQDNSQLTPDSIEIYSAEFWRSEELEKNFELNNLYKESALRKLSDITKTRFQETDIRCYKLLAGNYYRSHCDDYAADIGLILYLSKKWKYDWGGILNIVNKEEEIISITPKYNRAVIIWHNKFRLQHCVSQVMNYALEPRYSLTTFNRVHN